MSDKRPTIYDVARAAGVTAATVSHVLTNNAPVAPSTRDRVEAAIENLGYRPNLVARDLARRRGTLVALVVPSITNPIYAEMALAIERLAATHDYHLVVCNTGNDPQEGRAQLRRLSQRWVDAVIVMPGGVETADLDWIRRHGLAIVPCIWGEERERPSDPGVDLDFHRGGALVAEHLLALGHRQVGVVVEAHPDGSVAHRERLAGFTTILGRDGVVVADALVRKADGTLEGGYAAGMVLLDGPLLPTAVFATNDLMALGILEAAADRGVPVPQVLSVAGFDDIALARHVRPRLTSVAMRKDALAAATVNLVLARILEEQQAPPESVLVTPELVIRDSTGRFSGPSGKVVC